MGSQTLQAPKESQQNPVSIPGGHRENWGETNMADASPRTDTSTDDTDDKIHQVTYHVLISKSVLHYGNGIFIYECYVSVVSAYEWA